MATEKALETISNQFEVFHESANLSRIELFVRGLQNLCSLSVVYGKQYSRNAENLTIFAYENILLSNKAPPCKEQSIGCVSKRIRY